MLSISKKGKINILATALIEGKKYKNVAELETILHISRRSVFYWLKQLNALLTEMNLDTVQHLAQGGYFLTQPTIDELKGYAQVSARPELNANDRHLALVWMLVQQTKHMSLANLANEFCVSKNTIIKDFKGLSDILPNDTGVINTSQGKVLVGSELAQRRWVYSQIEERNVIVMSEIKKMSLHKEVVKELASLQSTTGNYYSGDAAQTLIWYIVWLINRLKSHHKYLHEETDIPMDTTSEWAQNFLKRFVEVNAAEIGDLRKLLLAGQLQHVNDDVILAKKLLDITKKVARRFSSVSGIDMMTEDFLKALATHLYSTYFRIKYKILYRNSNLKNVKLEYSYLMNLTKYALKPFENFIDASISSDELALIAIYFGGEVKRVSPDWLAAEQKTDVVLVCTSGIGTSLLLFQQLSAHYPNIRFSQPVSLDEFENYDLKNRAPKLILTTTQLKDHFDIPTMTVQAIPSKTDFLELDRVFRQLGLLDKSKETKTVHAILDIITDYARVDDFNGLTSSLQDYFEKSPKSRSNSRPSLLELLTENHIQIFDKENTWQQAVQDTFRPLVEEGCVEPRYTDRIVQITSNKGPYMVVKDGVMLAHATPQDGVSAMSMSLLVLKQPVILEAKGERRQVQVFFGLAPVDRDSHVHALSQLLSLLQNDKYYSELLSQKSEGEIFRLLEQIQKALGD